jgi:hypothetical protein
MNKRLENIFGDLCTVTYADQEVAPGSFTTVPVNPATLAMHNLDPTYAIRWCSRQMYGALTFAPASGDKLTVDSKSYTIIEVRSDIGEGIHFILGKEVSAVVPGA